MTTTPDPSPRRWEDPDNETPLTVGQIRAALAELPDDAQAFVTGGGWMWDSPLVMVIASQQIAYGDDDFQHGDDTVLGAELWMGWADDREPARSKRQTEKRYSADNLAAVLADPALREACAKRSWEDATARLTQRNPWGTAPVYARECRLRDTDAVLAVVAAALAGGGS